MDEVITILDNGLQKIRKLGYYLIHTILVCNLKDLDFSSTLNMAKCKKCGRIYSSEYTRKHYGI